MTEERDNVIDLAARIAADSMEAEIVEDFSVAFTEDHDLAMLVNGRALCFSSEVVPEVVTQMVNFGVLANYVAEGMVSLTDRVETETARLEEPELEELHVPDLPVRKRDMLRAWVGVKLLGLATKVLGIEE